MMVHLAKTISVLLHPFLMPVYILLFVFMGNSIFSYTPVMIKVYCFLITFIFLQFIPFISVPLFQYFRLINDYQLNERRESIYPIFITILFTFIGFWLLGRIPYTELIRQIYLIVVVLLSVFSIITIRWKLSMHMTAIGAVCGLLLVLTLRYQVDTRSAFMWMLLLSGLLAASRLYLKKDNPLQIYAGFLLGSGVVITLGYLF